MSETCSAPQLGQGWVALDILSSRFHEQQLYLWELHGQAIQDTEYAAQTSVVPLTTKQRRARQVSISCLVSIRLNSVIIKTIHRNRNSEYLWLQEYR